MYPQAYIEYLVHFHGDRDYFECHEILEEYWKTVDPGNKHSIWVGLIQLAVSSYHHRRGNFLGAKRTLEKALDIFTGKQETLKNLGLDRVSFISLLQERLVMIEKGITYTSFNLPIKDSALLEICDKTSESFGFEWGSVSDMENSHITHRHKLRDRTDVIENRKQAIKIRKGNNL